VLLAQLDITAPTVLMNHQTNVQLGTIATQAPLFLTIQTIFAQEVTTALKALKYQFIVLMVTTQFLELRVLQIVLNATKDTTVFVK
jgi:hypothetical protein